MLWETKIFIRSATSCSTTSALRRNSSKRRTDYGEKRCGQLLYGIENAQQIQHDFQTVTLQDAIQRHGGEAAQVIDAFSHLNSADQKRLIAFLRCL